MRTPTWLVVTLAILATLGVVNFIGLAYLGQQNLALQYRVDRLEAEQ